MLEQKHHIYAFDNFRLDVANREVFVAREVECVEGSDRSHGRVLRPGGLGRNRSLHAEQ